jgi:hypothetical protein
MEKAIIVANKGGYYIPPTLKGWKANVEFQKSLLDPLFWQALGKAEGWKKLRKAGGMELDKPVSPKQTMFLKPTWQRHMHRLIDHIIEGKDIDDFFNNLLK